MMSDSSTLGPDVHPILLAYAATQTASFPLMLIIGREPNTAQRIVNVVGPYDFRQYPRCGFWNTSYGMVARVMGVATWQLKHLCIAKRSSPIVYADALPIGIRYHIANKDEYRAAVTAEEIEQHIDRIFSHESVIKRVKLVITSGLRSPIFVKSKHQIQEHCNLRNIPLKDLPFFYGTQTRKIQRELQDVDRRLIMEIIRQFESYPHE